MSLWPLSVPYPLAGEGYWSPVTSTLNWCEEDYYFTRYSAEIINSLTNLTFIFLAIKGIRNCIKNGHDQVFTVAFWGYLVVGTGSFLFHSTLKYPMQLVDELSMIYTTCLMFHATFSYGKSRIYSIWLAVFLIALALFITLYYHYLQDPAFHQNMYALLTAIVLFRSMWVMEVSLRPSRRDGRQKTTGNQSNGNATHISEAEKARRDNRDVAILKIMWAMVGYGLAIFLGGFAIWTLDNETCSHLRRWRRQVGLPWGIFLEGHGWWHIMTGIGAYYYITWGIWLRHCLNGKQDQYKLVWPRLITSLPIVLYKSPSEPHIVTDVKKKTQSQQSSSFPHEAGQNTEYVQPAPWVIELWSKAKDVEIPEQVMRDYASSGTNPDWIPPALEKIFGGVDMPHWLW